MNTLRTVEVALPDAAAMAGLSTSEFRVSYLQGELGPAPAASALARVPLLPVATAMIAQKAKRAHRSPGDLLPRIAGAVLVQLAEMELPWGRFQSTGGAGGGVGSSTFRNCSFDERRQYYESCLPVESRETKRFAVFSNDAVLLIDSEEDLEGDWEFVIDTRDVARTIKRRLRGELFIIENASQHMMDGALRTRYLSRSA